MSILSETFSVKKKKKKTLNLPLSYELNNKIFILPKMALIWHLNSYFLSDMWESMCYDRKLFSAKSCYVKTENALLKFMISLY